MSEINWDDFEEVGGQNVEADETWSAKDAGDNITGRYVAKKENVGENNSNIYVLETENGNVGVWGSTVLDTKFRDIAIGKVVAIQYLGEIVGKTGRTYKDFKVGQGINVPYDEA